MKSISLLAILLFASFSFAQIYTPSGTITGPTTNNVAPNLNNIGIGTATPTDKLDVVGNIKTNGAFKFALGGNITADATWIKFDKAMLAANILRTDNQLQVGVSGAKFLVNSTGNVGIGTTTPAEKLDVVGNIKTNGAFKFALGGNITADATWIKFDKAILAANILRTDNQLQVGANGINFLVNPTTGNVGIGTTTPGSSLVVAKGTDAISLHSTNGVGAVNGIGFNRNVLDGTIFNTTKSAWQLTSRDEMFSLEGYNGVASNLFAVLKNGNVGIGTTAPDEKLTVKGKIHTNEVRVDVLAPIVPDYVFEADYKLKNLGDLAAFIKENKHLPEVPSAKEMEQNGLMLAEMNLKLLKKIEELTLYAIEQNKEIETLQERLAKIEAKLK